MITQITSRSTRILSKLKVVRRINASRDTTANTLENPGNVRRHGAQTHGEWEKQSGVLTVLSGPERGGRALTRHAFQPILSPRRGFAVPGWVGLVGFFVLAGIRPWMACLRFVFFCFFGGLLGIPLGSDSLSIVVLFEEVYEVQPPSPPRVRGLPSPPDSGRRAARTSRRRGRRGGRTEPILLSIAKNAYCFYDVCDFAGTPKCPSCASARRTRSAGWRTGLLSTHVASGAS